MRKTIICGSLAVALLAALFLSGCIGYETGDTSHYNAVGQNDSTPPRNPDAMPADNNRTQDASPANMSANSGPPNDTNGSMPIANAGGPPNGTQMTPPNRLPDTMISACDGKGAGDTCSSEGPDGNTMNGTCQEMGTELACAPDMSGIPPGSQQQYN